MDKFSFFALAGLAAYAFTLSAGAQDHQHMMTESAAAQADARLLVTFLEPMRIHTLTRMRDHLLTLQEIDIALSQNAFDKAATIAEQRLGMSSLELHGAAHIAPFMPQAMQEIGTQMRCSRWRSGRRWRSGWPPDADYIDTPLQTGLRATTP